MNWNILLTPAVIWVFIPVTSIIVWGIVQIVQQHHRHRERQALIEQGIHPDYPPGEEIPADGTIRRSA